MDAQNAAGPDETKSAAAASDPSRHDLAPRESRSPAPTAPAKPAVDDPRPSPVPDKDAKPGARSSVESADERNGGDGANSDAETIVLPGKDGHSPSKARKVKHEDKSDDGSPSPSAPARVSRDKEDKEDGERAQAGQRDPETVKDRGKDGATKEKEGDKDRERASAGASESTDSALSQAIKKKRLEKPSEKTSLPPPQQNNKDSPASTPTSPPKSRRPTDATAHTHSDSNSDSARHKPPKAPKDQPKGAEKLIPHKRKAPRLDSEDEDDNRKARRQRTAPASTNPDSHPPKQARDHQQKSGPKSQGHARSVSPQSRTHRRSVSTSTQLPTQSSSGLSQKKKRVPAPLQSTEYHSDDSSAGGSPHPRSSKLRTLATPAMSESNASPAKVAPHKKHLDAHGQTFLARACARIEYDQAKQRLGERPEDLNVADYAGNTPLQIAAINGCEDIVKLLINAGCNLECVNYDKDTPLLDAVDNGHLGVVKLLLDAGVNPRKANVHGEEPLDRVNDEFDNADEIRSLLMNARQRTGGKRRTSEERNTDRASYGPESPRRSPVASTPNAQSSSSRRAGTVRATKTSNHLLYMPMDDKTLRTAAGRGDEETVTRILQVRDGCDDSEAMVNAARGGHDVVMQLLLALGGANPDPPPVAHMSAEVATPMLAAIGQENIKVIQLLLDQGNFDPTRKFKGETYYEIARRRQGTNWKEEEHALSKAYEGHRKPRSKDLSKTKSPDRREREREKEEREQKRASRPDGRDDSIRALKRTATSPVRTGEPKKKASSKPSSSPKEKRRSHDDNQSSPKRRLKNDDRLPTINVSDRESSPAVHKVKVKRAESELAAVSSDGEAVKPRRKLVSKAELRGEREKQRRASQVSSAPSLKDPASPHESRNDDQPEKEKPKSEKHRDRAKALKRDQSKDRLSVSGESTKRHRSSATPPHSNNGDKDDSEAPTKKRRLDAEGKERRPKEDRPAKPTMSREQSLAKSMKAAKLSQKAAREDDERREHRAKRTEAQRREAAKSISSDKSSIHVKCEDVDVDMRDAPPAAQRDDAESKAKQAQEEQEKKRAAEKAEAAAKEEQKRRELEEKEREEEEAKRKEEEEEKRRKEEEEKKARAEEEREKKRKEEEERKRKEEEEKRKEEEERKRKEEEDERKRKEEEERKRREEEERVRREEEERKQREEAERKRKEEEERLKEEEERKRREAEEKRKREEEERLRREQQEREAAEAARRKREEEEREHRERQRAAREAEMRRQREEAERVRLAKLPALLRWLESCPNPKTAGLADKFRHMQGVRYDTIRPDANGTADGREQWVLNTQVALLLGEKDLSLSRYTAWERIPVSDLAKVSIWRLESDRYALTLPSTFDLGVQLPGYYEGADPNAMTTDAMLRLRSEAWDRFLHTEMFFVKLSDLLFIVPTIPHLRNLRLSVEYREIAESEAQLYSWKASAKWKGDPGADRFHGFAPRHRYYVNGDLVGEEVPKWSRTSSTPFPERRVPRRNGITRVFPGEEDYVEICRRQGLEELLEPNGRVNGGVNGMSPGPVNGVHGEVR